MVSELPVLSAGVWLFKLFKRWDLLEIEICKIQIIKNFSINMVQIYKIQIN